MQAFNSIEQLRATVNFPPWSSFHSQLTKSNVDENDYNDARTEYYRRLALPDSDAKKYNNMSDYLKVSV